MIWEFILWKGEIFEVILNDTHVEGFICGVVFDMMWRVYVYGVGR